MLYISMPAELLVGNREILASLQRVPRSEQPELTWVIEAWKDVAAKAVQKNVVYSVLITHASVNHQKLSMHDADSYNYAWHLEDFVAGARAVEKQMGLLSPVPKVSRMAAAVIPTATLNQRGLDRGHVPTKGFPRRHVCQRHQPVLVFRRDHEQLQLGKVHQGELSRWRVYLAMAIGQPIALDLLRQWARQTSDGCASEPSRCTLFKVPGDVLNNVVVPGHREEDITLYQAHAHHTLYTSYIVYTFDSLRI
jgi:hypothetical protein